MWKVHACFGSLVVNESSDSLAGLPSSRATQDLEVGRPGRIPGRLLASWPLPCPWPLRPVPFQSKTGCIQDERLSQLVI